MNLNNDFESNENNKLFNSSLPVRSKKNNIFI